MKDIICLYQSRHTIPNILNWIQNHPEHRLSEPTEQDQQWIDGLNRGEEALHSDLVTFNLTPSIWRRELQHRHNYSLLNLMDWVRQQYDETCFNHWQEWLLDSIDTLLLNHTEVTLGSKVWGWLQDVKAEALEFTARDDVMVVYHLGLPTWELRFDFVGADINVLPPAFETRAVADDDWLSALFSSPEDWSEELTPN